MINSVSSNEVGANVKKASTDFGISLMNMEYLIRNMSFLIPCQEPSFSDIFSFPLAQIYQSLLRTILIKDC